MFNLPKTSSKLNTSHLILKCSQSSYSKAPAFLSISNFKKELVGKYITKSSDANNIFQYLK